MNRLKPLIHGHRGARGRRPENTLSAVAFAVSKGADAAEVDLCASADNQIVLHHDLSLSPLIARDRSNDWIDQPVPVRSLALADLRAFDVGRLRPETSYARRFDMQLGEDGINIPTLDEFVSTVLSLAGDEFVINIELKSDPSNPQLTPDPETYVALVLDVVARYEITHRLFLQSFDWKLVRLARRQIPELKCGCLTDLQPDAEPEIPDLSGDGLWTDGLSLKDFGGSIPEMIKAAGADVWSSNFRDLTPALIQEARDNGLQVYVWTVNEPADMQRMIDWGVDAITTDYPDRLVALRDASNADTGQSDN